MTLEDSAHWRVAGVSVAGTSHLSKGMPCQDRHVVRILSDAAGSEILVVAVADGAGSAERGEIGADQAVSWFIAGASQTLESRPFTEIGEAECLSWLRGARQAVLDAADADKLSPRAFACTFAAAVIGPQAALAVQIGDGIIAVQLTPGDSWTLAFWPQKGEYRNETRFLTDSDAEMHAEIRSLPDSIDRLAVCSDGLEDLCLDRAARSAFSPFFEELTASILRAPAESFGELVPALERYLNSKAVAELTDDDKTLVLATRKATK